MRMVAVKPLKYKTRRLKAGDEFDASDVWGRAFLAAKLARYAPDKPAAPPAATISRLTAPPAAEERNSIDDLRDEAEALGIDVDGRWGVVRLQSEIARAKL